MKLKNSFLTNRRDETRFRWNCKGYVADCLRTYLQQQGFYDAVIDIGKNIILMGRYQGKGWKTSLQTPILNAIVTLKKSKCIIMEDCI